MGLEQVEAIRWPGSGRSQEREDQPMRSLSVCGLMGQMSDTHKEFVKSDCGPELELLPGTGH